MLRVNQSVWACVGFKAASFFRDFRLYVRDAINWRARLLLPNPQYLEPLIGVSHRSEFIEFVVYILNWEEFDLEDRLSFKRATRLFIAGRLWDIIKSHVGEGCLVLKPAVFAAVSEP